MYNRVILMGRICHDLELKSTTNGIPVLSFRIAVDRRFSGQGSEKKSDFFSIVAWRQNAEFISKYFYKGRSILVEGELQTRQYTDRDGIERYVTEIVVDNARFTGEKSSSYDDDNATFNRIKQSSEQRQPSPFNGNGSQIRHPAETTNAGPEVFSTGSNFDFPSPSGVGNSYENGDSGDSGYDVESDYPF